MSSPKLGSRVWNTPPAMWARPSWGGGFYLLCSPGERRGRSGGICGIGDQPLSFFAMSCPHHPLLRALVKPTGSPVAGPVLGCCVGTSVSSPFSHKPGRLGRLSLFYRLANWGSESHSRRRLGLVPCQPGGGVVGGFLAPPPSGPLQRM